MHVCVELMVCTLTMMSVKDCLLSGCILVQPTISAIIQVGLNAVQTRRLISEKVPHLEAPEVFNTLLHPSHPHITARAFLSLLYSIFDSALLWARLPRAQ